MSEKIENSSGEFLGNIVDELGNISGVCTEIKETRLNCATTDDLNNLGSTLTDAVSGKVDNLQSSIESQTQTVSEIGESLTESVNNLSATMKERMDNFAANPPVQKVEKTVRIDKSSWQWYASLAFSIGSFALCVAGFFWQEGRIEQCRMADVKYHFIMMHNGVTSEGLDSIESWFRDPEHAKYIEKEVREYEERVQETARALQQKYRLEEKINELNSQNQNKNSRK